MARDLPVEMAGASLAEQDGPELLAVCGLHRPADDRPTRAGHPHPFLVCPAVQLTAVAVLIKEATKLARSWLSSPGSGSFGDDIAEEPKAGEVASSTTTF